MGNGGESEDLPREDVWVPSWIEADVAVREVIAHWLDFNPFTHRTNTFLRRRCSPVPY
ncbi:hypothetical protein Enr13x_45090 [Stieleria neptunia]|uniref:Uncharacterized protein n=1 Tax=Stieleria neptunia TaxID=2527979 RepID=A0A518HUV7_9BACT|nr:hypothetical protein Enr13x_45090 [Stieleria neptunia]